MPLRYRLDYPTPRPVPVECNPVGWPHDDADGKQQCTNTHFDTEAECWHALIREATAGVSLDARSVKQARAALAAVEAALVESAIVLCDVLRAHDDFKGER